MRIRHFLLGALSALALSSCVVIEKDNTAELRQQAQRLQELGKVDMYKGYKRHKFTLAGRQCVIIEPEVPLPGKKWIWKAEYLSAFPVFEDEMLKRGYYFAFMQLDYGYGSPDSLAPWNVFYKELTEKYGFHEKPILFGLSVGGLYIYNWAAKNPDKVSLIYGDNPVCDFKSWPGGKGIGKGAPSHWPLLLKKYHFQNEKEALAYKRNPVDNLRPIVRAGIPMVHAAAVDDVVVPIRENTDVLVRNCRAMGGDITLFLHPGGHHPHHGVTDFKLLVDTIVKKSDEYLNKH